MNITEHFNWQEFKQPAKHGFEEVPYPIEWIKNRLIPLCVQLEIIRMMLWNKPITILSGYRTSGYNKVVGGKPASQHLEGRAADFTVKDISPSDVQKAIRHAIKSLPFVHGLGYYTTFTHIDIRTSDRLATWTGGKRNFG